MKHVVITMLMAGSCLNLPAAERYTKEVHEHYIYEKN